jgi:ABC-2 type transport system ATP-binding protein
MLDFLDGLRPRGTPPADRRRRAELCERLELTTTDQDRLIRDDSRGTKQKIGLVSAFQHDPALLILDEPTTGLDPLVREAVFDLLVETGRAGRTVFHSSHVLTEVDRTCTRVGILRGGRLVALEDVTALRRTLQRKMVVRFATAAPLPELAVPGVTVTRHDGPLVELAVTGELDPLLRTLARHSVAHLAFPEPTLEDAFQRYYRDDPETRR